MRSWIVLAASVACIVVLAFGAAFSVSTPVGAQFELPSCKAGIHMISPSDDDFKNAAALLNTNGGAYCWVTIVIREDEMNPENLQRLHNLARKYKFQIIHRLEKGFDSQGRWYMPDGDTVQKFVTAIKTIIPSQKDVYIVLGNEPTHAVMCGGCTPESYAQWAMQAIDTIHTAFAEDADVAMNPVVMLAGQDVHSPDAPPDYYDAEKFMSRMFTAEPNLLCEIDAWASHNYPRDFMRNTFAGRYSLRGYIWELALAQRLAQRLVSEDCQEHVRQLPVFITETGYKVGAGGIADDLAFRQAQQMLRFYEEDPKVRSVTLFVYRSCGMPFEEFAITGCNGDKLNGVGQALLESPKVKGEVRHVHKARTKVECPLEVVERLPIECTVSAENLGTDTWQNIGGEYSLSLIGYQSSGPDGQVYSFTRFREVQPGETLSANLTYNPGEQQGAHTLQIGLSREGRVLLGLATVGLDVNAAPEMTLKVNTILGSPVQSASKSAQVQIFDDQDRILFRKPVVIENGAGVVGTVENVGLSGCYRAVLLVDGNLPVQKACVDFEKGMNIIEMPRLLPVDRDNDGKLSLSDILGRYR